MGFVYLPTVAVVVVACSCCCRCSFGLGHIRKYRISIACAALNLNVLLNRKPDFGLHRKPFNLCGKSKKKRRAHSNVTQWLGSDTPTHTYIDRQTDEHLAQLHHLRISRKFNIYQRAFSILSVFIWLLSYYYLLCVPFAYRMYTIPTPIAPIAYIFMGRW